MRQAGLVLESEKDRREMPERHLNNIDDPVTMPFDKDTVVETDCITDKIKQYFHHQIGI